MPKTGEKTRFVPANTVTLQQLLEHNPRVRKFLSGNKYLVGTDVGGCRIYIRLPTNYSINLTEDQVLFQGNRLGSGEEGQVFETHRGQLDEPLPLEPPWTTKKKQTDSRKVDPALLEELRGKWTVQFDEWLKDSTAAPLELVMPATPESWQFVRDESSIARKKLEAVIEHELAKARGVVNVPPPEVSVEAEQIAGRVYVSDSFVSPNYPGTTLDQCKNLTAGQIFAVIMAILRDMVLHKKLGILHLDVKPSNIIVSLDRGYITATLVDHGCSEFYRDGLTSPLGARAYFAPERKKTLSVTYKTDMYAFGISLVRAVYDDYTPEFSIPEKLAFISYFIESYKLPPECAEFVNQVADVIYAMLVPEPEKRVDCEEALSRCELIRSNHGAILEMISACTRNVAPQSPQDPISEMPTTSFGTVGFFGVSGGSSVARVALILPPVIDEEEDCSAMSLGGENTFPIFD